MEGRLGRFSHRGSGQRGRPASQKQLFQERMQGIQWHDRQEGSVGVLSGDAVRSNGGVMNGRQQSEIMHQSIAGRVSRPGLGVYGKEKAKVQSLLCKQRNLISVPRTHIKAR